MRIAAILVLLCLIAPPARAEAWYEGERGETRVVNLAVTGGVGLAVLASVAFRGSLQPTGCRWCAPPSIDADVRNSLVWDDFHTARDISDLTAVALPILGVGIAAGPVLLDGGGWGGLLDTSLPILGSLAINQALTQIAKLSVARMRPNIHFADNPLPPNAEDNVSFFSGHTSFAFAAATSTAMVVRQRGSRYEPAVWAIGLTLAASVGYLRIAGDKHYFSDVLVGAAVGTATGLIVPTLMEHDLAVSTDVSSDRRMVTFGGSF